VVSGRKSRWEVGSSDEGCRLLAPKCSGGMREGISGDGRGGGKKAREFRWWVQYKPEARNSGDVNGPFALHL